MRAAMTMVAAAGLLAASHVQAQAQAQAPENAPASGPDSALVALADAWYTRDLALQGLADAPGGDFIAASDHFPTVTPASQDARAKLAQETLRSLGALDAAGLGPAAGVDAAVLRVMLEEVIGDVRFREYEAPLNSDSNFWTYLAADQAFANAQDFARYIKRLRDLPRYFREHEANMRAGMKRGFTVPRVTQQGRDVSLSAFVTADALQSPFYAGCPAASPGPALGEADRKRLCAELAAVIARDVTPAYARLLRFYREEYLAAARTELAAHTLPEGRAYYAQQIRQYTTLNLDADAIHAIGLAEVARITAAMEAVKAEAGFAGSLPDFITFLRSDPQFVAKTPDELLGVSSYVAKRADDVLGRYFGLLPRTRFGIRPVDPAIAPFYTAGRGGLEYCQMNTYDLPSRPLYNIPALTLHECAPGHSMQAALATEREAAPRFRRDVYFSGFGEGWGLYTEFLGEEMGIYRTPYERFGRLSYEMWRAARLVIDTGIHAKGWSREQAIDYLASHTALSTREVETEVDRYIAWPGQALAYKLGEMTIRRLRGEAEAKLGERFDIRKFHDVVLALGSVPLSLLETRIADFIADGGQGLPGVAYD